MKFITVTHAHHGHKMHIALDKIITIQEKFDVYTGQPKTLITYGNNSGNYVSETTLDIMIMIREEL